MSRQLNILLIVLIYLACQPDAADRVYADDVADGQQALSASSDYPWYDAENDSLKQVPLQKSTTPGSKNRNSEWKKSSAPSKKPNTGPGKGGGFNMRQSPDFSVMKALLWVVVIMLFLVVIALMIWAFFRRESEDTSQLDSMLLKRNANDAERIENLPFDVGPSNLDLHGQAKLAYENGNYRESMIYMFSHMLLQMDRRHWIRLAKSKTNRQYLREIRRNKQLAGIFRKSMLAFEDVFFGNRNLPRERFEDCWNSLSDFEKLMSETGVESSHG